MDFNSLYKLYVMNDIDTFNKIYNEKFNSTSTIKFDLYIKDNQAFFSYDASVMKYIGNIRELNYRIEHIFKKLPLVAIDQYMRKSLIDEIEFTNKIEGVVSTRKDINDLINEIDNNIKTKNRFEGIVKKYFLLQYKNVSFNNSSDIRALYNEMLYNEIKEEDENNIPDGKFFRKEAVHVYKNSEKAVHTGILPESKIIEYMDKALNILNDTSLDVLIRVASFHYLFGYIHPFYDGNGRINRFISSYILAKYFNPIIGFRLSMTIKENLTQYLDAFEHTNDPRNKGDLTTFVNEFLSIIHKSYQKTEIYALEKKRILEHYENILKQINDLSKNEYNLLYVLIQCNIFGDFGLCKNDLRKILSRGSTTISELLTILKSKNLCSEIRSGRYFYYKANLEQLDLIINNDNK